MLNYFFNRAVGLFKRSNLKIGAPCAKTDYNEHFGTKTIQIDPGVEAGQRKKGMRCF